MKKITLLCGITLCCLCGFAQTPTVQSNDSVSGSTVQQQTETKKAPTLHVFSTPYLVGSSTVYRGDYYTYSVDGADPGSTISAWSTSNASIASLDNASGTEGTFYIWPRSGGAVSFTVYVQVNSGGTIYYLSMASQSVSCTTCPIP